LWEQVFPRFEIENHVRNRAPNDPDSPFSKKGDERRWRKTPTWWPMEGSIAWWPMEGEGATPFYLFSLSPNKFYLNL
jgi:hypothetical protein